MPYLTVDIYINARHWGNPRGEGHAVAVLEFISRKNEKHIRKVAAAVEDDTKNALTLKVIVSALKMLAKSCDVVVHTDNRHIKTCVARGWMKGWQKNGWVKADGKPPSNVDLWKEFYILMRIHRIIFMPYEARREFDSLEQEEG